MKIANGIGVLLLALVVVVSLSCRQHVSEPAAQVDVAAMKAALLAAWNDGDVDAYDAICTPGAVAHEVGSGVDIEGLDAIKEWIRSVRTAFPDFQWRIDDVFVAGDKGTLLWSWTGTNAGALPASPLYQDLSPTGAAVSNSGVAVIHFEDGMITESWSYYDMALQLQQLGFTITPPTATSE